MSLRSWFNEKWKDPVWSKVIATGICTAAAGVGGIVLAIWKAASPRDFSVFSNLIISVLTLKVSTPVWLLLATFIVIALFIWIAQGYRRYIKEKRQKELKRKEEETISPLWDEEIGKYTFLELYKTLENQRLQERTKRMRDSGIGPPNDTLLVLFYQHREKFNRGVKNTVANYDDGGYLLEILSPKLAEYGLVERIDDEEVTNLPFALFTYFTTPAGFKFFNTFNTLLEQQQGR